MAQAGAIAPAVNSQGSVRSAATADWKVQGALVQAEMTVAVARTRSWCALGVAVTAAAKAGSDGADGGSGHGGGRGR